MARFHPSIDLGDIELIRQVMSRDVVFHETPVNRAERLYRKIALGSVPSATRFTLILVANTLCWCDSVKFEVLVAKISRW
jgi:hypothetical protein